VDEVTGQAVAQPSVEDMAASVAQGILSQEEGPPRDEKGKFAPTKPKAEAPPQEAEEAPAEEVAEEQQEEQAETAAEVRRLKLKYKGEEKEFLEPEVIELAQKVYDYTQKSQQLARERDELQQTIKSHVEPKLKEYETQLEQLRMAAFKLADQEAFSADLNKLAESDPVKAQQLFFKRLQINQTLQSIGQEQQRIASERQAEEQKLRVKQAEQAVEILQNDIPSWSNDLYQKVLSTAVKEYGFKAEEVNAITDPRAIKVLHDAMQLRQLKAKPVVEKRVPPSAPKVAKPGTSEKPDASAEKWNQTMAKLKKSGRTDDAVELAKLMLARESK
jgi:hypothetical protein